MFRTLDAVHAAAAAAALRLDESGHCHDQNHAGGDELFHRDSSTLDSGLSTHSGLWTSELRLRIPGTESRRNAARPQSRARTEARLRSGPTRSTAFRPTGRPRHIPAAA